MTHLYLRFARRRVFQAVVVARTYRSAVDDPLRFTSSKKVGP